MEQNKPAKTEAQKLQELIDSGAISLEQIAKKFNVKKELVKETYKPDAGTEKMYHVYMSISQHGQVVNEKIQTFGKKSFETFVKKQLLAQGYELDILHNPNAYLKSLEQKKQTSEAEKEKSEAEKIENMINERVQQAINALNAKLEQEKKEAEEKKVKEEKPIEPKLDMLAQEETDTEEVKSKRGRKPKTETTAQEEADDNTK